MSLERTLAIVKPDAVERGLIGRIIARMEAADLKPVALKMARLTAAEVQGFYAEHKGKPFYETLVAYMASDPVVLLVLEGEAAVQRWRKVMGATNPANAEPDTIRKDFAETVQRNSVHGSDSTASAAREIAYFFSQTEACPYQRKPG